MLCEWLTIFSFDNHREFIGAGFPIEESIESSKCSDMRLRRIKRTIGVLQIKQVWVLLDMLIPGRTDGCKDRSHFLQSNLIIKQNIIAMGLRIHHHKAVRKFHGDFFSSLPRTECQFLGAKKTPLKQMLRMIFLF